MHLTSGFLVQVAGGLIGQDQQGIVYQRASEGHPLLLSARQAIGEGVAPVRQAHFRQQGCGAATRLAAGAVQLQRQNDILPHGQHRYQVEELEDEPDIAATKQCPHLFVHRQ